LGRQKGAPLRRNLKKVPVVDDDGNVLYDVDRQTAIDLIKSNQALSVKGRAIRMQVNHVATTGEVRCGSIECRTELHVFDWRGRF
jgi:hypothetical protein